MAWLGIQTVSTTGDAPVQVELGVRCQQALVKNFGENDIWVGVESDAAKTEGMARIPAGTAQVVGGNVNGPWPYEAFDTLYIISDASETDSVEVQPVQY